MYNPHQITRELESAICEYTGAKYCVVVNSCTMALLLAMRYKVLGCPIDNPITYIPKRTYVSVPQSIIHAGARVKFRDTEWEGMYELAPFRVYDSARYFTSDMYERGTMQCLSFHTTKVLGDTQGGAILHDDAVADEWLRRARFDGRTEGVAPADDDFRMLGYHCYISPDVSARLLWHLSCLPKHNAPLPNDNYPDLSKFEVFNV